MVIKLTFKIQNFQQPTSISTHTVATKPTLIYAKAKINCAFFGLVLESTKSQRFGFQWCSLKVSSTEAVSSSSRELRLQDFRLEQNWGKQSADRQTTGHTQYFDKWTSGHSFLKSNNLGPLYQDQTRNVFLWTHIIVCTI